MFPTILIFFLIFIFICVIRKKTVATKIEKIFTIILLIGAVFSLPNSINDGITLFRSENILTEFTEIWIVVLSTVVSILVFSIVSSYLGVTLIERFLIRKPSVTITNKTSSVESLHGKLFFEVIINGRFSRAFVKTTIKDNYGQERTFLDYYNENEKTGKIIGKIIKKTVQTKQWKCVLPKEFDQGVSKISIEVINTIPILFSLAWHHRIGHYSESTDTKEKKSEYIQ